VFTANALSHVSACLSDAVPDPTAPVLCKPRLVVSGVKRRVFLARWKPLPTATASHTKDQAVGVPRSQGNYSTWLVTGKTQLVTSSGGSTTNHSNRRPKHVSDTRQGNIPSRKSRLLSHESKSGCWAVLPQLRWSAVKQYISIKTSPATRAGQQRLANEFSRYEYGCYSLRRSSLAPNDWRPSAIARVAFTAVSGRGSMHPVDSVLRVVGD